MKSFEWLVLPWPEWGQGTRRRLPLKPPRMFKPTAILIWGAQRKTVVHQVLVACERELVGPVDAAAFEPTEISHDDFCKLLVYRGDEQILPSLESLGAHADVYFPTLELGCSFEVDIEGTFEHAVFIGQSPRPLLEQYPP